MRHAKFKFSNSPNRCDTILCRYDSAFSRRDAPEGCCIPALTIERACGTPGARCTLGPDADAVVGKGGAPEVFGVTGIIRRSARDGVNGLLRGTPDDRSTGFPSPFQERCRRPAPLYEAAIEQHCPNARRCVRMTRLGPSGCRALRQPRHARPPHPRLAIVTIALAPLSEAGCTRTTII